jgi:GAF domain-containing protein
MTRVMTISIGTPDPISVRNSIDETRRMADDPDRSLGEVLVFVAEEAHRLTGALGAGVDLADGDDMVCRSAVGSIVPRLGMRLSIEASLSGWCHRNRRGVHCDDAEADGRVDRATCARANVRSIVVAPLVAPGGHGGVLKVFSPGPRRFTQAHVDIVRLLADAVSGSLSHSPAPDRTPAPTAEHRLQPAR